MKATRPTLPRHPGAARDEDRELDEHLPHELGATFGETPIRVDRERPRPARDRK